MKNLLLLVSILNKSIFVLISLGLAVLAYYTELSILENILGVSLVYIITISMNIIIENKLVTWRVNYQHTKNCNKYVFGKTCLLHFYH